MRQAGQIPDEAHARRFAKYLLTLGISCQVETGGGASVVWVHDDQQWERSRSELALFLSDPDADLYRQAEASAEQIRREQARKQQQYARNIVDVRGTMRPWTEGRFPLTWVLIAVSVALSMATSYGHSAWAYRWLYMVPVENLGDQVRWFPNLGFWQGQIWRLITPIFLNVGGMWHLFFNMYWMYQFGAVIETRLGALRLMLVVLATAIFSNLAQYYTAGPLFGGMSGVIYGLFGYIWMKSRFDPSAGIVIQRNLVVMFMVYLVLCYTGLLDAMIGGHVANAAHTGGLISGIILGYAPVLLAMLGKQGRR